MTAPSILAPLSRRTLLASLAGGLLAACTENPELGRAQFILLSDEQLAQLSDPAWADLAAQTPVVRDNGLQRRVRAIGEPIAAASGRDDLAWDFVVFDDPSVNAFVLPNGKVAVFKGLVDLVQEDAEIAAVLGHEVGHVTSRHAAERASQQLAASVIVELARAALAGGENAQYAEEIGAILGMGAVYGVLLPYSRKHEYEADRAGVALMREAGFDPAGALRFWTRMVASSADRPAPPEVLSTHPADRARLSALHSLISGAPPPTANPT